MKRNPTETDVMLSILHLDRGINFVTSLEYILRHLSDNPEEFNSQTASKLIDVTKSIRGCFHDCYSNHLYNKDEFEDLYETVCESMIGRD